MAWDHLSALEGPWRPGDFLPQASAAAHRDPQPISPYGLQGLRKKGKTKAKLKAKLKASTSPLQATSGRRFYFALTPSGVQLAFGSPGW